MKYGGELNPLIVCKSKEKTRKKRPSCRPGRPLITVTRFLRTTSIPSNLGPSPWRRSRTGSSICRWVFCMIKHETRNSRRATLLLNWPPKNGLTIHGNACYISFKPVIIDMDIAICYDIYISLDGTIYS